MKGSINPKLDDRVKTLETWKQASDSKTIKAGDTWTNGMIMSLCGHITNAKKSMEGSICLGRPIDSAVVWSNCSITGSGTVRSNGNSIAAEFTSGTVSITDYVSGLLWVKLTTTTEMTNAVNNAPATFTAPAGNVSIIFG